MLSLRTLGATLLALTLIAPAAQAEFKAGFVNTAKLLEEAPQAKDAVAQMEKDFAPREKEMIALQQQVLEVQERLDRDGAIMAAAEREKLERELLSRKRDLKRAQDEFTEDLNIRRNDELTKLQRKLYETIVQLAKDEKFDVIFGDGVVYASDRIDITPMVLKRLSAN